MDYEQARAEFAQAKKDGRPARFTEEQIVTLNKTSLSPQQLMSAMMSAFSQVDLSRALPTVLTVDSRSIGRSLSNSPPSALVSVWSNLEQDFPDVEVECIDREPLGGGLSGYLEGLDRAKVEPREVFPNPRPQTTTTLDGFRWVSADETHSFQIFAETQEGAESYIRHLEISQAPYPMSAIALTPQGVVRVPHEFSNNPTYTIRNHLEPDIFVLDSPAGVWRRGGWDPDSSGTIVENPRARVERDGFDEHIKLRVDHFTHDEFSAAYQTVRLSDAIESGRSGARLGRDRNFEMQQRLDFEHRHGVDPRTEEGHRIARTPVHTMTAQIPGDGFDISDPDFAGLEWRIASQLIAEDPDLIA